MSVTITETPIVVEVTEAGANLTVTESVITVQTTEQIATTALLTITPAAVGNLIIGQLTSEANPRMRIQTDRIEFGAGTGVPDVWMKRSAARALRIESTTLPPTFGGIFVGDTQPRWLLDHVTEPTLAVNVGRVRLGRGGTTAVDTGIARGPNAGELKVLNYLHLPNLVTKPVIAVSGEPEQPGYLYVRTAGGVTGGVGKLFYRDNTGIELGPIGQIAGLLRQLNMPVGGLNIFDGNMDGTATGLTGVDAWGILAGVTAYGSSSADVAYSPAITITAPAGPTDLVLSFSSPVVSGDVIVIDTEKIAMVGVEQVRGYMGTTAAAHLSGASVLRAGGATQTVVVSENTPALEQDTSAVSGTTAGLEWKRNHGIHTGAMLVYNVQLRDITNVRFFLGFSDQTLATTLGSDDPTGNYWGIQFSTARGDTEFKAVSKDMGGTQNLVDTGWGAINVEMRYFMRVEINAVGVLEVGLFDETWAQVGSSIELTSGIPPLEGAILGVRAGIRNLAAESKRMRTMMVSMMLSPSVA